MSSALLATLGPAVGFLVIGVVGMVLFVLLWMYLKKTAPGGEVPEPEGETAPAGAAPGGEESEEYLMDKARSKPINCPRCGVPVVPSVRGYETAECPNCGAPIFVQVRKVSPA